MKVTHVTTRVLSTPADNPLVVGLPAPSDTREFVTLELGTDQGLVGLGLTFFGGALTQALKTAVDGLAPKVQYHLRARITRGGSLVKELAGKPFKDGELKDGRLANCCDTRIARAGQNSVRTDSESPPLRSMAWRAFGLRSRERRSRRRSRTGAGWPPLSSVPTARGCSPVFPITRCACGTRKRGGFSPRRSSTTASSGVPVSARMAKTDPQASSDEVTPPVRESPVHLAA